MPDNPDLILLHAPAIYDFRKVPNLLGPISDLIPSTPIFEMFPYGFVSIHEYLRSRGMRVRIINLAVKMLYSEGFRVERLLSRQKPAAFGIDLHWLPHVQGSLAVAEILKTLHPEIPIIFGGLSSSYFHEELIKYPQVDYVVRGDSTEEPLYLLLESIKANGSKEDIPNLTWKTGEGEVTVNPLSFVPEEIGKEIDYEGIIKDIIDYRDLTGYIPFRDWPRYPITPLFTCRGCGNNCRSCGGSSHFFSRSLNRKSPALRDPALLARDVKGISNFTKGPIFLIGDTFQNGGDYWEVLLRELKKYKIKNEIAFEFFAPPPLDVIESVAGSVLSFNIEISPETHDERIREIFGRPFTNQSLEDMIKSAFELGCRRFDLFFMVGLSHQDPQSVLDTIKYCEYLLDKYGRDRRLFPFISPLAPFVDPGSEVFEDPDKFGYRLFHRTLEEHRLALLEPSWKYSLNYETRWMSRDDIVQTTYEAGKGLIALKEKFGLISKRAAEKLQKRVTKHQELVGKIDEVVKHDEAVKQDNEEKRGEMLLSLKRDIQAMNKSTLCHKRELEWGVGLTRLKWIRILWIGFKHLLSYIFTTDKHSAAKPQLKIED